MAAALATQQAIGPLGVLAPPEIHIESTVFTGSLGMLFQCVRDRKIELLDVPLAPICEAYFQYVLQQPDQDLESSAVALAALSYLIERKAWLLLPSQEVEEPEGEDILEIPDPYVAEFDNVIEDLLTRQQDRDQIFFRTAENDNEYQLPFNTENVTSFDLAKAFEKLIARAKPDTVRPVSKPRRSLSDQMVVVLKALPEDFQSLDTIVTGDFTRSEVVWWFLALLELIRLGQARVKIEDEQVLFARGQTP